MKMVQHYKEKCLREFQIGMASKSMISVPVYLHGNSDWSQSFNTRQQSIMGHKVALSIVIT